MTAALDDPSLWPMPSDDMFVRPDWPRIRSIIEASPAEWQPTAWGLAVDRWLAGVTGSLNELIAASGSRKVPYRVDASEHFRFVSPYSPDIAAELPTLGEAFRNVAMETLGGEIARDLPHPYPVLIFHDPFVAQEYLRHFGINAGAVAGVFISGETIGHIVMHNRERFVLRLVLIHELSHAMVERLTLPTWINEGLSRMFEARLLSKANMRWASDTDPRRNRYWREHGLAEFLSGAVFHGGRAELGYVLAYRLLLMLRSSGLPQFTEFLLSARQEDAGDAACRRYYKRGLEELAVELLGTAKWKGPIG